MKGIIFCVLIVILSLLVPMTANPNYAFAGNVNNVDNGEKVKPESNTKVLVVYNASSPESVKLKNYYIANRPGFAHVNSLGITVSDVEIVSLASFETDIRQPIVNWLLANPKKIRYIVMLRGIPSRIIGNHSVDYKMSLAFSDMGIRSDATALVTHLNMGSLEATKAYIDKLKVMYNSMKKKNIVISADKAGGTNYYLDEAQGYTGYPILLDDRNALLAARVIPSRITYTPQTDQIHITSATDVLGYETWGYNGGMGGDYAINGTITFSGKSNWYLIKTLESYNGQWTTYQGNFVDWFSANAFGGTNYSNTPVGATTHVEEPYTSGVAGPSFLVDWEKGLLFAECAWDSRNTPYFMAIGDPLVKR